jgi:TPR repeat protein
MEAQFQLAEVLLHGWGVPKNLGMAASYFRRAADGGHNEAMCRYGRCLLQGIGVKQDLDEAARWFKLGADAGHAMCQLEYGQISKECGDLNVAYTYSQLAAAGGNPAALALCAELAKRISETVRSRENEPC